MVFCTLVILSLFKNEEMRKTFNTDQNMALSDSWKAFYVLHNDNQSLVGSGPGLTPRPLFPPSLHLFCSNLLTAPRHTETISCSGPLCDQLRLECSCPDLWPEPFLHDSMQACPLQDTLLNHPSLSFSVHCSCILVCTAWFLTVLIYSAYLIDPCLTNCR